VETPEAGNVSILKGDLIMKKIEVIAAILHRDGAYFATQRGYGEFEGMWEFPGGKIEPGESREVALKREIQEELGVDITIENLLCTTEYDYPSFHLIMHCYLCSVASGEIELREHKSALWLTANKLDDVAWLPADKEVIDKLITK
jgi:8-oxo-dGTP diphosphatase